MTMTIDATDPLAGGAAPNALGHMLHLWQKADPGLLARLVAPLARAGDLEALQGLLAACPDDALTVALNAGYAGKLYCAALHLAVSAPGPATEQFLTDWAVRIGGIDAQNLQDLLDEVDDADIVRELLARGAHPNGSSVNTIVGGTAETALSWALKNSRVAVARTMLLYLAERDERPLRATATSDTETDSPLWAGLLNTGDYPFTVLRELLGQFTATDIPASWRLEIGASLLARARDPSRPPSINSVDAALLALADLATPEEWVESLSWRSNYVSDVLLTLGRANSNVLRLHCLRRIFEAGVHPDALFVEQDSLGLRCSALHGAIFANNTAAVSLLLEAGADPRLPNQPLPGSPPNPYHGCDAFALVDRRAEQHKGIDHSGVAQMLVAWRARHRMQHVLTTHRRAGATP